MNGRWLRSNSSPESTEDKLGANEKKWKVFGEGNGALVSGSTRPAA